MLPVSINATLQRTRGGAFQCEPQKGGPCTTRCAGILPAAMTGALRAPSGLILPKG